MLLSTREPQQKAQSDKLCRLDDEVELVTQKLSQARHVSETRSASGDAPTGCESINVDL